MKKILFTLVFSLSCVVGATNSPSLLDESKIAEIKKMNKTLAKSALTIKGAIDNNSSYVLKLEEKSRRGKRMMSAFLDKRTSILYMGKAYDENGKPILFPKDIDVIKNGVAFSYGTGSKEIYLATDPECPYCKKLEKSFHGKLDEYTVHVILFPLRFHKKAPAMVEWIMMGKDDVQKKERFDELMLKSSKTYKELIKDAKKPFKYSSEIKKYIDKSMAAAMELKLRGTPALFDAEMNSISQKTILKSIKK